MHIIFLSSYYILICNLLLHLLFAIIITMSTRSLTCGKFSPWSTAPKGSAFVMMWRKNPETGKSEVYVCRSKKGHYGVPGGKAEFGKDASPMHTARREMEEETGFRIPFIKDDPRWRFKRFTCMRSANGVTTCEEICYYIKLTDEMAAMLPVGDAPEKNEKWGEQEMLWVTYSDTHKKFRHFQHKFVKHAQRVLGINV